MSKTQAIRRMAVFVTMLAIMSEIAIADIKRTAVVHIETECRHPETGAKLFPKGSGVVFDKAGYILTAAHVVQCKFDEDQYERKSVKIRRGIHRGGGQLEVDVRKSAEHKDIAVLKIVGVPNEYDFHTACRRAPLSAGTAIMGYGFPEGKEYAPVPGVVGGETPDGNYAVVASFIGGMSGGPVIVDDYVVALIEGGAGDVAARRRIIPLFRAGNSIEEVTGRPFPFCDDIGSFSVRFRVVVEETRKETRAKKSPRHGVSTGSLVETKCQRFAIPATQGWKIDPGTVQIVDRIEQGSSRANIVNIEEHQIIVEFCARSVIRGFNKKTGDSFGAVSFQEAKLEKLQSPRVIEAVSDSGKIKFQLPNNTVKWSGELLKVGEETPLTFTNTGTLGGFKIDNFARNGLLIQPTGIR